MLGSCASVHRLLGEHRPSRWILFALLAGVSLLAPAATASGDVGTARIASGFQVSGRGFGHGVGLSQWGAQERALAGQDVDQILSFYYPGTTIAATSVTSVRVLLTVQPRLKVGSNAPFTVRDADGRLLRLDAGLYPVAATGRLGSHELTLPLLIRPGTSLLQLRGTRYHGTLRIDAVAGGLRATNSLPLEDYVRDVVSSECPGYWKPAALQAQAIASRTYAIANLHPEAAFDVYPDDRSQNYHGLAKELPAASAATAATSRQVLLYDGAPANTFFSASNGGWTSDGAGDWSVVTVPYLVSRADPFDAQSPAANWGPVRLSVSQLRAAFPALPDAITSVAVVRNDGDRALELAFSGADGTVVTVDGYTFQQRLGLRSTLLSLTPTYS